MLRARVYRNRRPALSAEGGARPFPVQLQHHDAVAGRLTNRSHTHSLSAHQHRISQTRPAPACPWLSGVSGRIRHSLIPVPQPLNILYRIPASKTPASDPPPFSVVWCIGALLRLGQALSVSQPAWQPPPSPYLVPLAMLHSGLPHTTTTTTILHHRTHQPQQQSKAVHPSICPSVHPSSPSAALAKSIQPTHIRSRNDILRRHL